MGFIKVKYGAAKVDSTIQFISEADSVPVHIVYITKQFGQNRLLEPVVRRPDSTIQRIVIFSTVENW